MTDRNTQRKKQQKIEQHVTNDYQIIEKLGSGAYGHVWRVIHKRTKKQFAIKKVFSAFQNDVDAQRTFRQISLLTKLNHPNIVKLHEVIRADNNMDLYLIFQYMQSDLFKAIRDDVLNQVHKKYIVFQIAKCLKYLHSAGVVHRDLKPSNILINQSCKITICDFGLSRTLWKYNDQKPLMTQFIATRWYRAPEVLFGSIRYDQRTDLWSFGCLIYELFTGNPLLPGDDSLDQIHQMLQFKGQPTQQDKRKMKVQKIQFVISQLKAKKKPQKYYFGCLEDKPQVIQLVKNLLEYNPQKRWSIDQILKSRLLAEFNEYQKIVVCETPIKIYPNDSQKLTRQIYRNMVYKFFIKRQQNKSSSKRSFLTQLKNSGSFYIGHRSLNHSKTAKVSLSSFSTVNNSIHTSGVKTPGNSNIIQNRDKILKRHKKQIVTQNVSHNQTPSMKSVSKRVTAPKNSYVFGIYGSLNTIKKSNQDPKFTIESKSNRFNKKRICRTKKQSSCISLHSSFNSNYLNLAIDRTENLKEKFLNLEEDKKISYLNPQYSNKLNKSVIKRPKLKQNKTLILNRRQQKISKEKLKKKNRFDKLSCTVSFENGFT